MSKSQAKFLAREMRREGKSIKSIARELGVSQGSVSIWSRDIKLNKEQLLQLSLNMHDPYYGGRLQNVLKQQQIRIDKTASLREEGKREVGNINNRELFLIGIALYWAEGYKKDHQVGLGSSDPEMMLLYVKWLEQCFGYKKEDLLFRVTVNEEHEYRIAEITQYWASLYKVDANEFGKPFYQRVKWKKQYEHPEEYYGVLRIKVRRSTDFLRKIHGFIEGLKNNV